MSARVSYSRTSATTGNEGQIFENLIPAKEAAKYIRVTYQTLLNMTSAGRLPYYKMGRFNMYNKEDLQRLVLSTGRIRR